MTPAIALKSEAELVQSVQVINQRGLHARAAANFVKLADTFDADISVDKGGMEVSGKSILGLMTLSASKGSTIVIKTKGRQAALALSTLIDLVNAKFYED